MKSWPQHVQIMVVGAGPVGMLTALALQRQGRQVLLLESRAAGVRVPDRRTLALSYHSVACFAAAGVVLPEDATTPIDTVHVSRQHGFGRTVLRAADVGLPYLGQTIDYARLLAACEAALQAQNVPVLWQAEVTRLHSLAQWAWADIKTPAGEAGVSAQWLILAEGGQLAAQLPGVVRHEHDYHQQALVNTLHFARPASGTAYERFTDAGPFALLPYGDAYRLVWTCTPAEAAARRQMDLDQFAVQIDTVLGQRLGALQQMGTAAVFPLKRQQLNRVYSNRVLCIGNAAQTLHPVAAQGLNLGVRDAMAAVQLLGRADWAHNTRLGVEYAKLRRLDAQAVAGFTHGVVTLFDHAAPWLQAGQGAGMSLLNSVAPWRRRFTEQLVFGIGTDKQR